jgi:hypothetical protein
MRVPPSSGGGVGAASARVDVLSAATTFAFTYLVRPGCIAGARAWNFEDAFFLSVQTLGTIGYGVMSPATRYGHIMVTLESIAGILTTALIIGITFARFAVPRAQILFSKHAVVAERDGVPHLMFRMANWRHNQILEAQLRVIVLITERTREGHEIRRPLELPLVRDRTAMFGLTWVVMHRIDEKSCFTVPMRSNGCAGSAPRCISVSRAWTRRSVRRSTRGTHTRSRTSCGTRSSSMS